MCAADLTPATQPGSDATAAGRPAGPGERALFDAFCSAAERGAPAVLRDPRWTAEVSAAADRQVRAATEQGRVGTGDLVLFSSGSTDVPRGIVRHQASWQASLAPLTELIGAEDGVTGVLGTLASSLSLYGAWHAVQTGRQVVLADEWDGPAAEQVTVLHATPLAAARLARWPTRLQTLVVAGDRVPAPLRQRCAHAGVRLLEYYGSVETSFVLVSDASAQPGGLRPFPGVDVRADDQRRLWSRSPYQFRCYLDPDRDAGRSLPPGGDPGRELGVGDQLAGGPATRRPSGAALRDGDWVSTGDLVEVGAHGFRLLGRPGAVTSGGHTVVLADVEDALLRRPGIGAAVVVAVTHPVLGEVVGAVVEADSPDLVAEAIDGLPAPSRPRRWRHVDRLPRLATGKPDRRAVENLLAHRVSGPADRSSRSGSR